MDAGPGQSHAVLEPDNQAEMTPTATTPTTVAAPAGCLSEWSRPSIHPNRFDRHLVAVVGQTETDDGPTAVRIFDLSGQAVIVSAGNDYTAGGFDDDGCIDQLPGDGPVRDFCWIGPETFVIAGRAGVDVCGFGRSDEQSERSGRSSVSGSDVYSAPSFCSSGRRDSRASSSGAGSVQSSRSAGSSAESASIWTRHCIVDRPCVAVAADNANGRAVVACVFERGDDDRDEATDSTVRRLVVYQISTDSDTQGWSARQMYAAAGGVFPDDGLCSARLGLFTGLDKLAVASFGITADDGVAVHLVDDGGDDPSEGGTAFAIPNLPLPGWHKLPSTRSKQTGFRIGQDGLLIVWGRDWVDLAFLQLSTTADGQAGSGEAISLDLAALAAPTGLVEVVEVVHFCVSSSQAWEVVAVVGSNRIVVFELGRVPGRRRVLTSQSETGWKKAQGTAPSLYVRRSHLIDLPSSAVSFALTAFPTGSDIWTRIGIRPHLVMLSDSLVPTVGTACSRSPTVAVGRAGQIVVSGSQSDGQSVSFLTSLVVPIQQPKARMRGSKTKSGQDDVITSRDTINPLASFARPAMLHRWFEAGYGLDPTRNMDITAAELAAWPTVGASSTTTRPRPEPEARQTVADLSSAWATIARMQSLSDSVWGDEPEPGLSTRLDLSFLGIVPLWTHSFGRRWSGRLVDCVTGARDGRLPSPTETRALYAAEVKRIIKACRLGHVGQLGWGRCRVGESEDGYSQRRLRMLGLALLGWARACRSDGKCDMAGWVKLRAERLVVDRQPELAVLFSLCMSGPRVAAGVIGNVGSTGQDGKFDWRCFASHLASLDQHLDSTASGDGRSRDCETNPVGDDSVDAGVCQAERWCRQQADAIKTTSPDRDRAAARAHLEMALRVASGQNIKSIVESTVAAQTDDGNGGVGLPVTTAVALGLIYLSDRSVTGLLRLAESTAVSTGWLPGLVFTGLTDRGGELVRRYVESSGDVLSGVLMLIAVVGRYLDIHTDRPIGKPGNDTTTDPRLGPAQWFGWTAATDDWLHAWCGWIQRTVWGKAIEAAGRTKDQSMVTMSDRTDVGAKRMSRSGSSGASAMAATIPPGRRVGVGQFGRPTGPTSRSGRRDYGPAVSSTTHPSGSTISTGGSGTKLGAHRHVHQHPLGPTRTVGQSAIVLRCISCLRPLAGITENRPGRPGRTNSSNPAVCGHCGANVAKCCVCLLPLAAELSDEDEDGVGEPDERGDEEGKWREGDDKAQSRDDRMTDGTVKAKLVQFCLKCQHGMHERHAIEWFSDQVLCPVPDCDCACGV